MRLRCAGVIAGIVLSQLVVAYKVSWSQIAFVALRDGRWNACVQADLGQPPKELGASGKSDVSAPALSAEGTRLAYEVQGVGIHVVQWQAGGEPAVLGQPKAEWLRPTWHPDGDKTPRVREAIQGASPALVYVQYAVTSTGEDSELVGIDHQLKVAKPLIRQTGIQDYPDFSHDGRYLAYTSAQTVALHRGAVQVVQQLWIMDLSRGTACQLLLSDAQDTQPDWAPSGDRLAFASNRSGQFEIWVVNTDGSGLKQLTSGAGAKTWPAWSPDGKSIMVTMVNGGRYQLWLMDADGKNLRQYKPFGPESDVEVRDADWR